MTEHTKKRWTVADWITKGLGLALLGVVLLLIGRDNDAGVLVAIGVAGIAAGAGLLAVGVVAKGGQAGRS